MASSLCNASGTYELEVAFISKNLLQKFDHSIVFLHTKPITLLAYDCPNASCIARFRWQVENQQHNYGQTGIFYLLSSRKLLVKVRLKQPIISQLNKNVPFWQTVHRRNIFWRTHPRGMTLLHVLYPKVCHFGTHFQEAGYHDIHFPEVSRFHKHFRKTLPSSK